MGKKRHAKIEQMLVRLARKRLPEKKSRQVLKWIRSRAALFKVVERLW